MELQSVIKRDGSTVPYNREKIITAISKANNEVEPEEKVTDEQIENIVRLIEKRKCKRMLVEDIQDIIETELMALDKFVLAKTLPLFPRFGKARQHYGRIYIKPYQKLQQRRYGGKLQQKRKSRRNAERLNRRRSIKGLDKAYTSSRKNFKSS